MLIFTLILVRVIIALFLILLIKMITDYGRLRIVVEDTRKVFRSLFQAAGFVFRRLLGTLAVYYLFVMTAAALFALYCVIDGGVKTHSLLPILISFHHRPVLYPQPGMGEDWPSGCPIELPPSCKASETIRSRRPGV